MAFLGVGFFAGIRAASPDMLNTIDKYFKESNVYDIEIVSNLGLTKEDIEELEKVENVEKVYGTYSQDSIINIDDTESVAKLMCVEEVNKPVLEEGRLPSSENECVVEAKFLEYNNKKIGEKIQVEIEDTTNDEGEKIPFLKQKELEIVGVVKSPEYISREKGTSKLGSGKVNYYIYIDTKNINAKDIYTQIYIRVKDSNKFVTSTQQYEDYIEEVKTNIENIKEERQQARHKMLVDKSNEKVEEAKKTLDEEKANAESKIADAQKQIDDAKVQIANGEAELVRNRKNVDNQFSTAQKQIDNAKEQMKLGEKQLQEQEKQVSAQIDEANKNKSKYRIDLESINEEINQINLSYNQMVEALKNNNLPSDQREELQKNKESLIKQKTQLEKNKKQLESGIKQIDEGIVSAKSQIEKAKQDIQNSKTILNKQEEDLKDKKKTTYDKLESAQKNINKSKQEVANGEAELEKNKQEFNDKITEAEGKLIDAKEKIADIENPTWYILDRNSNQGYVSFIQDTKSIKSLGAVFPIVFFVIATLISLTSMTRMVEEQRTQIGTLKALGYNKIQIASKYIIYASLACIIGGTIGMFVGCEFLPRVICMMYSLMYEINDFEITFNCLYSIIGLVAASLCIVGATIYAAMLELVNTPAILMRPKAPKNGKRVILERVPFIWKHLSFTRKVTVRNLFRYKKRFLMTIIGILGCTALIITGFGMRDSITSMVPNQYENVFKYDMQISIKNNIEEEQKDKLINDLINRDEINKIVETNLIAGKLKYKEKEEEVQIIIPKNKEEIDKAINLNDRKTKEKVNLKDNEIVITDKVADLLKVNIGDTIKLEDSDEKEIEFKISDIVENYIEHYVYMSKDLYEQSYGEYKTNVLYTINNNVEEETEDILVKEIIDKNGVSSVTTTSSIVKMIGDMLDSLNYVVIILIISAGILAFVVLYNLSNVNISERIRELATIKVLGFYDREVYNYISRETVILTTIGIVLGVIGGYFLNAFILKTCEISAFRFAKVVEPMSYIYSVLLTILFTIIVNIATYFSLKKIDMIENLKSVE